MGVPVEACLKQVSRYIENETFVTNKIGDYWQIVPKYFLIPRRKELQIREYTPANFVSECHSTQGVCWKTIIMAYDEANFLFPDPTCPKAPTPQHVYWLESEVR